MKLLADNVPVGTPIPIEVHGIGWRELEDSWVLLYDNRFTGWMSTITTGGTARFTIPATGQPGRHVIEVLHSDFTFPYRNMQQSPEPDRPQFKIGFTVTPGPPVLPPPPRAAGADAGAPAAAAGRARRDAGLLRRRSAGGGQGTGFAPGKTFELNWTTRDRQPDQRRRTAGKEERRPRASAGERQAPTRRMPAMSSSASRRRTISAASHALWVDTGTASAKTGTFWIAPTALPLDVARGPVETTFQHPSQGRGLDRDRQHLHGGLRQRPQRLCLRLQQPGRRRDLHAGDRRAGLALHRSLSGDLQGQGDPAQSTTACRSSPARRTIRARTCRRSTSPSR